MTDSAALLVNEKFHDLRARLDASASAEKDCLIAFIKGIEMWTRHDAGELLQVTFPRQVVKLGHDIAISPIGLNARRDLLIHSTTKANESCGRGWQDVHPPPPRATTATVQQHTFRLNFITENIWGLGPG